MGQTSRSHHHPSVEPARHPDSSRRDSRREPDNGAIINDRFREMNIDSPFKATRKENDGRRNTYHHADGMSSGRHSARIGERGTNVAGNHRSGRESEARPRKGDHPSKLGAHHDNGGRGSKEHPSEGRHHGDRSAARHDNHDRGSRDHPSGGRHHSGRPTHRHTGGLDPAGRDQITQSRHQGGRSVHRHVDGPGPDLRDQPTQNRHHGERGTHERGGTLPPQGHSKKSGNDPGGSTHRHKNGPGSKGPPNQGQSHGKGTQCREEDMEVPQPTRRSQPPSNAEKIREQLFQEALEPISVDTGTPYPCNQADIDFHQRGVFKKDPDAYAFVSCRMATKEVLWQNDERRPTTPDEEAALDRLWTVFQSVEDELTIAPDLVIKAFSDLDLVFFGGRLRGNVAVQWTEDEFFCDRQAPLTVRGHCSAHHNDGSRISVEGRCHIRLNATIIFRLGWRNPGDPEPWQQMIGSLLHEMCHAYEFVRSPREKEPDGHGPLFNTRISVVHKRALRMLGMFAISRHKNFKQFHAFVPYPDEGQQDERGGPERDVSRGKPNSQSQRGGAERDISRGQPNSQSQRGGAERDISKSKPNSRSERGGPEKDIGRTKSKSERGGTVKDGSRSKPHDGVRIYEYR